MEAFESEVIPEDEYFPVAALTPPAAWLRFAGDGVYARLEDTAALSRPTVTLSVSLDRAVYSPRLEVPVLKAQIMLRVNQAQPLELTFRSSQRFELIPRNEEGEEIYRWSEGRAFAPLFGTKRISPGERNWLTEVPLQTQNGNQFPQGKYTAECWLTNVGERRYAATVGFEIAPGTEPVAGLSGNWIVEAQTSEGLLRARLALEEDGKKLSATLWIDNHVLKGAGKTDGEEFDVLLAHTDGSGPGHSEQLRLTGKLKAGRISGSFDSGTDRGVWTGRRE